MYEFSCVSTAFWKCAGFSLPMIRVALKSFTWCRARSAPLCYSKFSRNSISRGILANSLDRIKKTSLASLGNMTCKEVCVESDSFDVNGSEFIQKARVRPCFYFVDFSDFSKQIFLNEILSYPSIIHWSFLYKHFGVLNVYGPVPTFGTVNKAFLQKKN